MVRFLKKKSLVRMSVCCTHGLSIATAGTATTSGTALSTASETPCGCRSGGRCEDGAVGCTCSRRSCCCAADCSSCGGGGCRRSGAGGRIAGAAGSGVPPGEPSSCSRARARSCSCNCIEPAAAAGAVPPHVAPNFGGGLVVAAAKRVGWATEARCRAEETPTESEVECCSCIFAMLSSSPPQDEHSRGLVKSELGRSPYNTHILHRKRSRGAAADPRSPLARGEPERRADACAAVATLELAGSRGDV